MDIKNRVSALKKEMEKENIDLYYIPTDDDHMSEYIADHFKVRQYMSGFTGSAGMLVIGKESILWADGRYYIQSERQLKNSGIKLYKMGMANVCSVFDYLVENSKNKVIGFDGKVVSADFVKRLKKATKDNGTSIKLDEDLVDRIWQDRPAMPDSEAFILNDKYTGNSIIDKIEMVRKDLRDNKCDALVVSALEDVAWLFNLRGDDIKCTPVNYAYALVTDKDVMLFIDEKKINDSVLNVLTKNKVLVFAYEKIADKLQELNGKVWVDTTKLNAYLFDKINADIYDDASPIAMYRAIKNKTEIKCTKNAHVKDGVAMCKFIYWLKSNIGKIEMSEISVQNKLYELRAQMDDYLEPSFNTICAYEANAAMMHYSASEQSNAVLDTKGFLLVDSGGTYYDGTTDITRTICLGKIDNKDRLYYTTVLKAMLNLQGAKFLEGTTGANLDILARGVVWDLDIDYQCGTGHGVGHVLSVHEGPHSIRWSNNGPAMKYVLKEGMIVTDEPGIYLPNDLGIRIENELLVVKGKKNEYGQFMYFEPLTMCPIDLDAVDVNIMSDRELKLLNDYHELVYKNVSPYLNDKEKLWLKMQTRKLVR